MRNIAILKDQGILRDGVQRVLKENLAEQTVSAYSSQELGALYRASNAINLIIIDVTINIDVFNVVNHFMKKGKKIAVWIEQVEDTQVTNLFKKGLSGYFFNGMTSNELIEAVEYMLKGGQYIHPHLSPVLLDDYIRVTYNSVKRPNGLLTEREWDVLEYIVQGDKNDVIAEKLYVSPKTVKNHVVSIFKKLNVTDRTNAALKAIKNNWIAL